MDLVQLTKPNENEDTTAPVLRAMEEIKKFEAEAILLFIDKENVELMLQQVILCTKLNLSCLLFSLSSLCIYNCTQVNEGRNILHSKKVCLFFIVCRSLVKEEMSISGYF